MAKLEIARQHIFAYTGKKYGVLSYYLILGTSTYGCIHCKIKNTSKFENIVGLKIDNIGYACINNIQHTPWSKFNFKATTPYRKLTDQEYSLIVNAISNYMLGNIGFANDNTMLYTDQIAVFNANLNKTTEESFESTIDGDSLDENDDADDETTQEDSNTEEEKTDDLPEAVEVNKNPDTIEEDNKEELSDSNIIDAIDKKTETVDCAVEVAPQPKITHKKEEETKSTKPNITDFIPKENIETPEEGKVGGVKCYNLLEQDCVKPYYVKTNEAAKRSTTRVGNKAYRHIFTEEETFSIARMNAKLVVTKYNVSMSIASVMVRNAKRIFDVELPGIIKKNNYTILFESGYSVEEVQKITKGKINKIKECHKLYNINKNSENNSNDIMIKYDKIIQDNNIDLLIKAAFEKSTDFTEREKCTVTTARNIQFKIRQKIFMNPLYVIGMNPVIACDPTKVYDYIEGIRMSKNNRNSATVDAIIMVYEKTMQLLNAYVTSYDKHADIMIGDEPIPESVSNDDKDAFMTLITNRFNFTRLGFADRKLTHDQKYVVNNNGSASEYILAFMTIDVNKAYRLKASYKRFNNSEVAAATV